MDLVVAEAVVEVLDEAEVVELGKLAMDCRWMASRIREEIQAPL